MTHDYRLTIIMLPLEGRSKSIFIVTTVFLGISFIAVCLRCFVRLRLVKAFGWDDALMVFAMVNESPCFASKVVSGFSELLTTSSLVSQCSFCAVWNHWLIIWNGSEITRAPAGTKDHGDRYVCKFSNTCEESKNKSITNVQLKSGGG